MVEYQNLIAAIRSRNETLALELLQTPGMEEHIADEDNVAFRHAAERCLYNLLVKLLEIRAVRDNATANNNYALRIIASTKHCLLEIQLLLNVPCIVANITAENSYALRILAVAGDVGMMKALREKTSVDQDPKAIVEAMKSALKGGHRQVAYEIHKLIGPKCSALIKSTWSTNLQYSLQRVISSNILAPLRCAPITENWRYNMRNTLKSLYADKVAMALFYRNSKRVDFIGFNDYISKLPQDICRKIAEYNLGELPKDPTQRDMLHLYMYASSKDYIPLLEDAVAVVDRISLRH